MVNLNACFCYVLEFVILVSSFWYEGFRIIFPVCRIYELSANNFVCV